MWLAAGRNLLPGVPDTWYLVRCKSSCNGTSTTLVRFELTRFRLPPRVARRDVGSIATRFRSRCCCVQKVGLSEARSPISTLRAVHLMERLMANEDVELRTRTYDVNQVIS